MAKRKPVRKRSVDSDKVTRKTTGSTTGENFCVNLLDDLREASSQAGRGTRKKDVANLVLDALEIVPANNDTLSETTLHSWITKPPMYSFAADAMAKVLKMSTAEFKTKYNVRTKSGKPTQYIRKQPTKSAAPGDHQSIRSTCLQVRAIYDKMEISSYREIHDLTTSMIFKLDRRHVWVGSSLSEAFRQAADGELHDRLKGDRYESINKGAFLLYLLPNARLAATIDEMFGGELKAVENRQKNLDWIGLMRDEYVTGYSERHAKDHVNAEKYFDGHVQCWQLDEMPLTPIKHTVSVLSERDDSEGRHNRQVVIRYPMQHVSNLRAIPQHESNTLHKCFVQFLQHVKKARNDDTPFTKELLNRIQGHPDRPPVEPSRGSQMEGRPVEEEADPYAPENHIGVD